MISRKPKKDVFKAAISLLLVSFLLIGGNLAVAEEFLDWDDVAVPQNGNVNWAAMEEDYIRLVNKENLLDSDYVPDDLVKISAKRTSSTAIKMRKVASEALSTMFADAKDQGLTLYAHSGYRSYRTQNTMYYNRLKDKGKDDGAVAYPGSSDHQTGLGIDVISKAWIGKRFNSEFAQTKEAQWMAENCFKYGFIIRYPQGKEDITEIIYEPWHLRYVGIEAATYITQSGFTLEEFTPIWQEKISQGSQQLSEPVAPINPAETLSPQAVQEGEISWFDNN